jgi:hypothetical protein
MNHCHHKRIYIAYPLSAWFANFVGEVYPNQVRHPAVLMWSPGNEFDLGGMELSADLIAQRAAKLVKAEDNTGIQESERIAVTAPVSFAVQGGSPGVAQCFDTNKCKSGPDDKHPNVACDLQVGTGGNFVVNFGDPSP